MHKKIENRLRELNNKFRFISCIISGEIEYLGRKRKELLQDLIEKRFDRLRKKGQLYSMEAVDNEEYEKSPDDLDFEYLTSIQLRCLNEEYLHNLLVLIKKTESELVREAATPQSTGLKKSGEEPREVMREPPGRHHRTAVESLNKATTVLMEQTPKLKDRIAAAGLKYQEQKLRTQKRIKKKQGIKQNRRTVTYSRHQEDCSVQMLPGTPKGAHEDIKPEVH